MQPQDMTAVTAMQTLAVTMDPQLTLAVTMDLQLTLALRPQSPAQHLLQLHQAKTADMLVRIALFLAFVNQQVCGRVAR